MKRYFMVGTDIRGADPALAMQAISDIKESGYFDGITLNAHFEGCAEKLVNRLVIECLRLSVPYLLGWDMWPYPLDRNPVLDIDYWQRRLTWIAEHRWPGMAGAFVDFEPYTKDRDLRRAIVRLSPQDYKGVVAIIDRLDMPAPLAYARPCGASHEYWLYNAITPKIAAMRLSEGSYYRNSVSHGPHNAKGYYVTRHGAHNTWTPATFIAEQPYNASRAVCGFDIYAGIDYWNVAAEFKRCRDRAHVEPLATKPTAEPPSRTSATNAMSGERNEDDEHGDSDMDTGRGHGDSLGD